MTTTQVNKAGIARTFQNIRLFDKLSGRGQCQDRPAQPHTSTACGTACSALPRYWKVEKQSHERALELLSIFDMQDLASAQAGSACPTAHSVVWRSSALWPPNPKLLLLDEPAAGMNPSETAELMENIRKIRDTFHIAILLIEHDMSLVMGICEGICCAELRQDHRQGHPGRDPEQSSRSSRPIWARRRRAEHESAECQ